MLGAEGQRNGPGLVVLAVGDVGLRVAVDERLERAAGRTALPHVDLVVAQDHLGVDDPTALGADAARQLVEDVVGVGLVHECRVSWHSTAAGESHQPCDETAGGARRPSSRSRSGWTSAGARSCRSDTRARRSRHRRRSSRCAIARLISPLISPARLATIVAPISTPRRFDDQLDEPVFVVVTLRAIDARDVPRRAR